MFFVDAAAVVAGTVDTTAFFFSTKTHFNNAAAVQKHPKQNHSMIQGHPTMWIRTNISKTTLKTLNYTDFKSTSQKSILML